MMPSLWDVLAGVSLSISLLTIILFGTGRIGTGRIRRQVFFIFCFLVLGAFAWHAGCWYHQFQCPALGQAARLTQQ